MKMLCQLVFILATLLFSRSLALNVFILAGQSNMSGRGGILPINGTYRWDRKIPRECRSRPQILRLNDELLWEEAKEPLHKGISFSECIVFNYTTLYGVGPGMPFASSILMSEPTMGVIGLVPCAVGNTYLRQWRRGSCLYNRLLKRVRAAMVDGGVLRGMLWYQGENDANNMHDAEVYKSRLEEFFTDVRSDLMSPFLPIIQVALASWGRDAKYTEMIRNAQLNSSLPNVKCVDAKGLPLNPDKLHLQTRSQVRLGIMMADTYLRNFL